MSATTAAMPKVSQNGLLAQVKKGKSHKPPRLILYGTPGIGKSTFASTMPDPIFIQTEEGADEIDAAKFPIAMNYNDVLDQIASLYSEKHDYRTVIVDTLDWLERMIWITTCQRAGVENIEEVGGGYAKGYTYALAYWNEFLRRVNVLRDNGMIVCLLAHAKVERFEDPESPAYDRYSPKLHKTATALLVEWADAVLFATRRVSTRKEKGSFGKERNVASGIGEGGGERVMRCVGGPACIAKNRYGIPGDLPLAWAELVNAIQQTTKGT